MYHARDLSTTPKEEPIEKTQGVYRVPNMLRVTVRDVEEAGEVLDTVVEVGASQVHGVGSTEADECRVQGQTCEQTMAGAKTRAGVEQGARRSVSEIISAWPMALQPERTVGGVLPPSEFGLSTQVQVTLTIR